MFRFLPAFLLLSVSLAASGAATASPVDSQPRSFMRLEWERHLNLPWELSPDVPFKPGLVQQRADGNLIVFGYLPYWMIGDVTLQLDVVTHLAYFGVDVNGDGSLGDSRHWGGPVMDEIIASAHAAGVKVVLVGTAFSATAMTTLLSSPTSRAVAIQNMVDLVVAADGDGVNLDFEGLPHAMKDEFVLFVGDMKAAMDAALGESSVTLAMPAVDWSDAYDYDALADACDGLFLMEYDYHYAGGDPGPLSPLAASATWGKYSVTWSLDDYDTWGGERNRNKFILGMPLYGYDWPATSSAPLASKIADATSVTWSYCLAQGDAHGWKWDNDSSSPWYVYYSGEECHQVWCENQESLRMRMALAKERGLGGIGFWALGYEGDQTGPWQAIADTWDFSVENPPETVETADLADEPVTADEPVVADKPIIADWPIADDAYVMGELVDTLRAFDADGDASFDTGTGRDSESGDAVTRDSLNTVDAVFNPDAVPTPDSGGSSCSTSGRPASVPALILLVVLLLFPRANHILCRRRTGSSRAGAGC